MVAGDKEATESWVPFSYFELIKSKVVMSQSFFFFSPQMTTNICSLSKSQHRSLFPLHNLSSICNKSNTTGSTSGPGTAFIIAYSDVRVVQSSDICILSPIFYCLCHGIVCHYLASEYPLASLNLSYTNLYSMHWIVKKACNICPSVSSEIHT